MKISNPTRRKEKLRCPKRYYFRYFHKPISPDDIAEHSRRRQLYGIRELAGHLVHRTLSDMTTTLADGSRWDYDLGGRQCRNQFTLTVAKSLALESGQWGDGLQVAETFNGQTGSQIKDEVNYWKDIIPTLIENGFRAAHSLHIGHATSERSIESEKRLVWSRPSGPIAYVADVLIRCKIRTEVWDFKSHSIDNQDIAQIRSYLELLHRQEGICPTRLHGIAVDLRRGEIVPVDYDPYKPRKNPIVRLPPARVSAREQHPAKPHPDLCVRCPYATICPSAEM